MKTREYSLIVGCLPSKADNATAYLQHLESTFREAIEIFVVMSDERLQSPDESELLAVMLGIDKLTIVLSHNSVWDGINRAVADAGTHDVVILEREMWAAVCIESEWFKEAQRSGAPVTYFEKRHSFDGSMPKITVGRYSRSSPELIFASANAFAIERRIFLDLRGYDERPAYRDFADVDFSIRLNRARVPSSRMRGPDGVVYYPSYNGKLSNSIDTEIKSEEANLAKIERDKSIYRNLVDWSVPVEKRVPLVSVAIATKDRGEMLSDALYSVLYQTFQDFEIIVVDDGSDTESAKQVIENINDPRIRYIFQESAGISAARNRAADESNCTYTAVHDDDDIMLPDRLEIGLKSITRPYQSTFGGWVNFGDGNGQMKEFYGKLVFDSNVNAHNGQSPGHATWTVPTKLIQEFRYDIRLTASVDHNLATRMEIAGVEWIHTGHFMYLRRVHDNQVTALDSGGQKIGHSLSRYLSNLSSSTEQLAALRAAGAATKYPRISEVPELLKSFRAYLPDKLVARSVKIEGSTQNPQFDADTPEKMALLVEDRDVLNNRNLFECAILEDIKLRDVATFRRRGLFKYSWIINKANEATAETAKSVDELADGSFADGNLEEMSIDQSRARVLQALESRVSTVSEKLLAQYPQGSLLVVENEEHYSGWVDADLTRDAIQARRVLVAGEFGVKASTRLYVYRTVAEGREVLAQISDRNKAHNSSLVSG